MDTSGSDSTAATPTAGTPVESSPTESVTAGSNPAESPVAESSATDGPVVGKPVSGGPVSGGPASGSPVPGSSVADTTGTDGPAADTSATDGPVTAGPAADAPAADSPSAVTPADIAAAISPGASAPTPTAPSPAASAPAADEPAAAEPAAAHTPAAAAPEAPTPTTPSPTTPTPGPAVPTPAALAPAAPHPAPPASIGAVPAPPAVPAAAAASGESAPASDFGWIDAEGTVFVKTKDGSRAVGSWQAGSADEGLHHFQRRYDDLVTEVELLEARLQGGMSDAAHTRSSAERLRESLAEAAVVGDLDALAVRLDALIEASSAKADEQKVAKARAREEATARKQALVAEAEEMANNSTQWKAAGDRLRDILIEWKTIRGVDRKTDTELWRRYAAARDGFSRRRGSHFAGLDAQRKQIQGTKEQLVAEAQALAESTDWQATANRLKQLMNDWKTAGRAPREAEEQLWKRFRAAQDTFFANRSTTFSERDAELKENQTKKEALLAEAERIDPQSDLRGAQAAMRDVQARWDDIGRVPREAVAQLDRRLRAVEERVRVATDVEWRRGSVESNPLLGQMREQVAKAEKQLERARTQGDQRRIAEAEKALASKRQFLDLAERAG